MVPPLKGVAVEKIIRKIDYNNSVSHLPYSDSKSCLLLGALLITVAGVLVGSTTMYCSQNETGSSSSAFITCFWVKTSV